MLERHPMSKPRLLMVNHEDWFFWSHRRALAVAALEAGFDVTIATPVQAHGERIRALGLGLEPLQYLRRGSREPLRELHAIGELTALYARTAPDIVHHVNIKPVLYGSIAAWRTRVPRVVNGIYGLGYTFTAPGLARAALRATLVRAYRGACALHRGHLRVTFENEGDRDLFLRERICHAEDSTVIHGMGFDPEQFPLRPPPAGVPVIMLAARLLWSKGVGDLVEAGRILRSRGVPHRLVIVGRPDHDSSDAVSAAQLERWVAEGAAEWWGQREDMPETLAEAAIVALPSSYGEGLPKVLIEGAALGRPLVATDIPGCRPIVRQGENGIRVPVRDPVSLAGALEVLLRDAPLRARYGERGHAIAAAEFCDREVNRATLGVYADLMRAVPGREGRSE
jgi:glycosyltransferase involved in cell wall biosynthesis